MSQFNPLNEQQVRWVEDHLQFFNVPNQTMSKEDTHSLFAIYTWVSGKNQKPTGCGRCIASAKAAVWAAYKQTEQ